MHHRSKLEILRGLDPRNPASIQALIDFHRSTFGGWRMEEHGGQGGQPGAGAGDGKAGDQPKPGDGDGKEGGKPKDGELGENGLKALQAERDARQALQTQLTQLKEGLAAALGVDKKDAKSSTDDVLTQLQQQMATLTHSNLVLAVANEHQITDKDDLALLTSITDEDQLRKLAARLKPSEQKSGGEEKSGRRAPKPDPSQGRGSGEGAGRPASVAQVMADRKAAREAKTST